MEARLVTAQCRTTDFAAVEAALRDWTDVAAVGSFREKTNNKKDLTTVFVTFVDEDAAKAAGAKLSAIKELIMEKKEDSEKKPTNSNATQKRNKNMAAEFMKFESIAEKKRPDQPANRGNRGGADAPARGRGRGSKRNNGTADTSANNKGNNTGEPTSQRRGRGGRGGRGSGRGRGGQQQQQNPQQPNQQMHGRGRGRYQHYQRLPPVEANAAFADNIPFGTTNDQLMEVFSPYGNILDINRLELMAMVCYDNPESVQQCIQHVNGTKIGNNYVTVSSGIVRIPGNVAAVIGM